MTISDLTIKKISADTDNYLSWLQQIDLSVNDDSLITGPYISPDYPVWSRYHDNFHFPLGMRKLLELGFAGIRDSAFDNAKKFTGNEQQYLLLIHQVYKELSRLIEACSKSAAAPKTLIEACQLYWFATVFRIGTSTIGRLDQHLIQFYLNDFTEGRLDKPKGRQIIAELLYRYEQRGSGKGDTLQNITLAGKDENGVDQTNELTYIILELCLENNYLEPKLNVRLDDNSPDRLRKLICEFQLKGTGICTVFNDEALIPGLRRYGRPARVAADYCADGCSEIILDGHGETWFRYIDCVKAIEHTLFNGEQNLPASKKLKYYAKFQEEINVKSPVEEGAKTGEFLKMKSFTEFYQAYLAQLKHQVDIILSTPYNSDEFPMRLFTAATMPDVLETASEPYSNTACFHTYGLFIGSLGTAVNSLAAIKSLVFEKKVISQEKLLLVLRNNFEGYRIIQQQCLNAPKFGNDDDYVDSLAVAIAEEFAAWVKEYKERAGRPILPGLYNHLFHHTAFSVGATPDGRKFGDPVGEHISPTPGTAIEGPTAIINSLVKINTGRQVFGSTLHLNIPSASLLGVPDQQQILKGLTRTLCNKRGSVININVLNSEVLREAQKDPERYKDLIVRVWGFSYYFTLMSKEMQDHIIARAEDKCAV